MRINKDAFLLCGEAVCAYCAHSVTDPACGKPACKAKASYEDVPIEDALPFEAFDKTQPMGSLKKEVLPLCSVVNPKGECEEYEPSRLKKTLRTLGL